MDLSGRECIFQIIICTFWRNHLAIIFFRKFFFRSHGLYWLSLPNAIFICILTKNSQFKIFLLLDILSMDFIEFISCDFHFLFYYKFFHFLYLSLLMNLFTDSFYALFFLMNNKWIPYYFWIFQIYLIKFIPCIFRVGIQIVFWGTLYNIFLWGFHQRGISGWDNVILNSIALLFIDWLITLFLS